MATASDFVATCATRPIAFAQVREDPELEARLLRTHPNGCDDLTVMAVASGGDTVAFLLGQGAAPATVSHLTVVDVSTAQLLLTQEKLHALHLPPARRRQFCAANNDCGRYEGLFAELRRLLAPSADKVRRLFAATDVAAQTVVLDADGLDGDLRRAFGAVMTDANLTALFGPKAVQDPAVPFAQHFYAQTVGYLRRRLASESPWMAQMLLGDFVDDDAAVLYPWYALPQQDAAAVYWRYAGTLDDALAVAVPGRDGGYDAIFASNVCDWQSAAEVVETLRRAYAALRPGGLILVRQLNSRHDLTTLPSDFVWDTAAADDLLAVDRSFFYRRLYVGRKS
jgi:S-adenosylmethionine-diacylglycerol 3-amino-3-carboxypropyl transferase